MTMTVSQAFDKFKSDLELNKSFQDSTTTHHTAIRKWITTVDSSIETKLVGSLQRKTRIQQLTDDKQFDIDILVVLGSFYQWVQYGGISPQKALDNVDNIVSDNSTYDKMDPEQDSPTITLRYSDGIKVELIPAYRDNIGATPGGIQVSPPERGYWIPKNSKWIMADYDYDAAYISSMNSLTDEFLIPVIKMLKAAKRKNFSYMPSFYLEALSASIVCRLVSDWKARNIKFSYPELIWGFFNRAKADVKGNVTIPGSKSFVQDSGLGASERSILPIAFADLEKKCRNALTSNDSNAIKTWKDILGDPFPSEEMVWISQTLKS